jgi:hypothetical protein
VPDTSVGHAAELPEQVSSGSQEPVDARQTVPEARKPSGGQAPDEPVQLSAISQAPAEARHVLVAELYPSTQCPVPSQESVPSQGPLFDVPTHVEPDDFAGFEQTPVVGLQVPALWH